jgi:hypothetical protein
MKFRQDMVALCYRFNALKDDLLGALNISLYGQHVDQATIRRSIEVLWEEVIRNVPAYQCPKHPHPVGCTRCGGNRWLTENQHEMTGHRDLLPISQES